MRILTLTTLRNIMLGSMTAACLMAAPITAAAQEHAQEPVLAAADAPADELPVGISLHSNGLYWLAATPNIGIEFQTDLGIAAQIDYAGAWWNSPSRDRWFSNYGFQAEVRYYFQHEDYAAPFTKWHAGIYTHIITFDFEFGGKGYQCPEISDSWGVGLSAGYTLPVSRRLALDFTVGLGYFSSLYWEYVPNASGWYSATARKKLDFFGPTKVEVSLVWSLNKDHKDK